MVGGFLLPFYLLNLRDALQCSRLSIIWMLSLIVAGGIAATSDIFHVTVCWLSGASHAYNVTVICKSQLRSWQITCNFTQLIKDSTSNNEIQIYYHGLNRSKH